MSAVGIEEFLHHRIEVLLVQDHHRLLRAKQVTLLKQYLDGHLEGGLAVTLRTDGVRFEEECLHEAQL